MPAVAEPIPSHPTDEQRLNLVVELAQQALACLDTHPSEAHRLVSEAHRHLGQVRLSLALSDREMTDTEKERFAKLGKERGWRSL